LAESFASIISVLLACAGVQDHAAGRSRILGDVPVVKVAGDAGGALGILELPQVVEDALALRLPEPMGEPAQELRAAGLVAATLTYELALEGVEGVDVVARPGRRRRTVDG
jgi:hypothetical protein